MNNDFLLKGYDIAKIYYKKNEPLSSKSTFKVGSTADIFVIPNSIDQLNSAAGAARAAEENYFILGGGSNIVFPDESYHGIIISTECLNNISMTDDELPPELPQNTRLVTCEAGTPMAAFVNFCTKHNLSGAEQFAGLPGSIGGATYMNARCFDKSISDIIYETQHIEVTERGRTRIVSSKINISDWDYKKSPFQSNQSSVQKIICSVTFILNQLSPDFHEQIENSCKKYISQRVDKGHFKFPSAGSVFKNNRTFGKPSGQIIDEAGLKGFRIGGAQIAPFHGNFIINIDNAKSKDISDLVEYIQKVVKEKYNFELEPEIIFLKNQFTPII